MLIYTLIGIILGTYGLAYFHHLVHKYKLFNSSVVWKHHYIHHTTDHIEPVHRKQYHMLEYSLKRTWMYLTDFKRYGYLDLLAWTSVIYNPYLSVSYLIALILAEQIGYVQHTWNNYTVDFTHPVCNFMKAGSHGRHHTGKPSKFKVETNLLIGLLACNLWAISCIILYPLLFLPIKPTIPGAYVNFVFRNIANYKAMEGKTIRPVLFRMSSVFDKPELLLEYLKIIFFGVGNTSKKTSHTISPCRNIYTLGHPIDYNKPIILLGNKIIEGHHRLAAENYKLDKFKNVINL